MQVSQRNHRQTESYRAALRMGWLKRKEKGLGIAWNKGLKGFHVSPSTQFFVGYKHSEETKEKFRSRVGSKASNWKGGITPEGLRIRTSTRYAEWRVSVFKRDDYSCVRCKKRGGKLHAHHIKSFAKHEDLRFDIDNGETLCVPCHKETDSYGKG